MYIESYLNIYKLPKYIHRVVDAHIFGKGRTRNIIKCRKYHHKIITLKEMRPGGDISYHFPRTQGIFKNRNNITAGTLSFPRIFHLNGWYGVVFFQIA